MSFHYLFMCPQDPEIDISNWSTIIDTLTYIQFLSGEIGKELENTQHESIFYKPGDKVEAYLYFDCLASPEFSVRYRTPEDLCKITFESMDEIQVSASPFSTPPQCKNCAHHEAKWTDMLSDWYEMKSTYRWQCPQCQTEQRVYDMQWHGKTAFYRYGFSVELRMCPGIPTPHFLDILHQITQTHWQHIYGHL